LLGVWAVKNATRILWVSPLIFDVSLHRTAQLEMTKSLTKRGYNILLFGMRSRAKFRFQDNSSESMLDSPRIIQIPIRYFSVIAPAIYAFIMIFLIPLTIFSFNPDFVVIEKGMLTISSIPSILVSKFRKTKFILDIRSVPVEVQGLYGALHKFWYVASILIAKRMYSSITIVTPMAKEELCAEFSISSSRVGVWENGADVALFDPEAWRIQSNELKTKLGLSGKFIVFYSGYLVSTRGIIETVEAMKIVTEKHSDVVLFLLGAGPLATTLKSSIKKENIQNIVIVHDAVGYEQVPKFISICDVGISPTPDYPYWRFQSPLSIFEYLSMEKPVLATDLPLHRRIFGNQECGIYMSSANPEIIAKAIEFAVNNKNKLRDWGKTGRILILRNYTWEKLAENFESFIMSL
jgi:glycosyltransferase involved in cell wall biosynthesis